MVEPGGNVYICPMVTGVDDDLDAFENVLGRQSEKDEKEKGLTIATRAGKGGLEASLGMEGDEAI